MQGFHHRGEFDPPEWANNLKNYYWYIRVEGRDKAKRRRYYRRIYKEKLRLVESGVPEIIVEAACRYLVRLEHKAGLKLVKLLEAPTRQLTLPFDLGN